MLVRIYSPAKTPMQSGKAKTHHWVLEYIPQEPKMVEPLMGYISSTDIRQQIKLRFATKEEAVAYALAKNLPYHLQEPKKAKRVIRAYADNFRFDRHEPWTH